MKDLKLTVRLSFKEYQKFRLAVVKANTTIQAVLKKAIDNFVERRESII